MGEELLAFEKVTLDRSFLILIERRNNRELSYNAKLS
jgi:hypothetical protein